MARLVYLHRLWRDAVVSQRGTVCESCGESEETTIVEAHHLAPVKNYPALAYLVENGAVLCCRCHAHLHSGRSDLIDRVNAALVKADPARIDWLHSHISDPCPDYNDPEIVEALRVYLRRSVADGFEGYYKKHYRENREAYAARFKAYRETHKEELTAYNRKHYQEHKAEIQAQHHAYYEAHKAEISAQYKAYYERKKAKKKEWSAEYLRKHRAEKLERERQYRATHQDVIRKWRAEHREELAAKERERRRLKRIARQTESLPVDEPT